MISDDSLASKEADGGFCYEIRPLYIEIEASEAWDVTYTELKVAVMASKFQAEFKPEISARI